MKPNYNFIIRKAVEIYEMLSRYKKKPYIYNIRELLKEIYA